MGAEKAHQDGILIVLVEDEPHHRKKMKDLLTECFPNCEIKTIAHGIEAMNYLLTPVNKYHLVILDGKLDTLPQTFMTKVQGPDVAAAMKEKNINVQVVLWTNDPAMLNRFDEIYGKRLPEIEKPCRKSNIEVILTPIINSIANQQKENLSNDEDSIYSPTPS